MGVKGWGAVELPGYGFADAEHQVEKEIGAAWPGAVVEVLDVARPGGDPRIVEEFRVRYRVRGTVPVAAEGEDDARREALRVLRARFAGTRFERIAWEVA